MHGDATQSDAARTAPSALGRVRRPRWERAYARALVVTDLVAFALAAMAALAIGFEPANPVWDGDGAPGDLAVVAGMAAIWIASMALTGAYEAKTVGVGSIEYKRVGAGALIALAATTLVAFTLDLQLSRAFVYTTVGLAVALAGLLRQVVRKQLHRRRAAGRFTHRVVVAGSAATVADLVRHFRRAPFAGYSVVAVCVPGVQVELVVDGEPIPAPGGPDAVLETLVGADADTLAVADPTTFPGPTLRALAWDLEGSGVDLIVAPAVTEIAGPRIAVRPVAGIPLLHVEEPSLSGPARVTKAAFDRTFGVVALVVCSPILLVLGLLVRITSHGPALFHQTRVGRDGREFQMLKFRTMVVGAEEQLDELRERAARDHVLFKLPDDPRLTRIGRWLRRHSLDELPQLWNVVKGDMSVVGPRPPLPSEVAVYADDARRRLLVKPGLTGLWQVSGRADLTWDDTVRLDLYYVENWSWVLDALILVRTIPAVIKGRGAY
jgi:exopolysaccharide biosynthesis polyprenyl glycosylphosphotransferase